MSVGTLSGPKSQNAQGLAFGIVALREGGPFRNDHETCSWLGEMGEPVELVRVATLPSRILHVDRVDETTVRNPQGLFALGQPAIQPPPAHASLRGPLPRRNAMWSEDVRFESSPEYQCRAL